MTVATPQRVRDLSHAELLARVARLCGLMSGALDDAIRDGIDDAWKHWAGEMVQTAGMLGIERDPPRAAANRNTSASKPQDAATAKAQGYEGDACTDCGNFTMVRNGTCLKCMTCGSTTGCS